MLPLRTIINRVARKPLDAKAQANAVSFATAYDKFGSRLGLDQPHRLAQMLAQVMHENGEFRYDRELWGPTPAQERYDTRVDLGNTPEIDGDGKLYMGRTGIQITGKANYRAFRDWCRKLDPAAPDFVLYPDLVNTDPWEGLGPFWYWSTRDLNKYADQGDVEMVTKRINGGLNGYDDRIALLTRASLVLLGYQPDDVRMFQTANGLDPDGIPGPKTRAALHVALLALTSKPKQSQQTATAPVVEEKPVAVTPPELDKPVTRTGGFWERIGTIAGAIGIGGASWLGDWKVILALSGVVILLAVLGLLLHARIIAAVKAVKQELQQ